MATTATPTVTEKVIADAEELPKAVVKRLVKQKLSQLSQDDGDMLVPKDSLMAFAESSRIFIHYLSATANDICKESKRHTINAEDVFKALEEIEFPEFVASLKTSLEEFKRKNSKRKSDSSKSKEATKKNKTEETTMENGEAQENGEEDVNEVVDGDEDGDKDADSE
ncbi:DNA polymerase II subunit B4 [Rutidosis leptorrhynchoides]|uniref:DNA polymerase II subunit B4 n=1 Tax=Rutidosis leptorrhynchoides TaxID=125765 RepID=UPI003A9924AD